jgi:predicted Zn finger-like uncharacterized protein
MYTRCPHCDTVYRVTPQQLQASSGQVKCGRCQAQFDAFSTLAAGLSAANQRSGQPAPATQAATVSAPAPRPRADAPLADTSAVDTQGSSPAGAAAPPPAQDPVAAYVHRYGARQADDDSERAQRRLDPDSEQDSDADYEEIEGVPAAGSSIDQFADSLRVFQTVARLSLDVNENKPGGAPEQPWVEATDAEQTPDTRNVPEPADESEIYAGTGTEPEAAAKSELFEGEPAEVPQADEAAAAEVEDDRDEALPQHVPVAAGPALTLPDELIEAGPAPVARRGPWIAGIAAMAVALLVQGLWWFASPIALALPAARPALESVCGALGCTVALPQLPEQLFIEGSDLQLLDVARPHEVLLTAQVRNRAAVAQQLPLIELTLTNTANQVVARRVLSPEEYLDAPAAGRRSIQGNEEIAIRLYLNTGDVRAAGYRLYLFFG